MHNGETAVDKEAIKQFAEKVYVDMAGAMATGMAYVGVKTGLFRAMAGKGPMGAGYVAEVSGLQPRYVEEWLKGMTSCPHRPATHSRVRRAPLGHCDRTRRTSEESR